MLWLPHTLIRLASVSTAHHRLTNGLPDRQIMRGVYVFYWMGVSQQERLHCRPLLSLDIIKLCDCQMSAFLGTPLCWQMGTLDVIFICRHPDSVGRFQSLD